MATINDPNTAGNVAYVGPVGTAAGDQPLHVSVRPDPVGALGHYIAHVFTGNIGAGAGALSELVQLRYTSTNNVIVYDVVLEHFRSLGTAFVAGNFLFDVIKSTAWTADGTGGVTQVPILFRTGFAVPTATVRVATTAALGAGTKTLALQPFRAIRGIVSTAINAHMLGLISAAANITVGYPIPSYGIPMLPDPTLPGAYPVHLGNNEGLSIRATVPGTGVWEAAFTIRFAETTGY